MASVFGAMGSSMVTAARHCSICPSFRSVRACDLCKQFGVIKTLFVWFEVYLALQTSYTLPQTSSDSWSVIKLQAII